MDAVEAEADGSDPMERLVVNRHESRETFTRYRLQETLMLMGCRPKDAVAVTKEVFVVFYKYVATHSAAAAGDDAGKSEQDNGELGLQVVRAIESSHASIESAVDAAQLKQLTLRTDKQAASESPPALPWHYLHQCIYSSLARLDYTKPHHLLDFQVAKEITQRNQSFVVLLGGTSGTGKSTLASLLAARLRLTTVLPTDSVRHILRAFTSKEENPCAFVSTYQAGDALTQAEIDELSIASDGTAMSTNRLHKRKVLRGYKLQSEVVLEKLDKVLTMFERRKQSLVVEGVHLNTDQMMELVRRHPNCVPFVIYISNELKHRERFAVRARHMTIDPQENKYIKYFDNIRIIQRHLCKHADKYLIPKIDNTNVDRSIATIQSTLIRVLRKLDRGEKIFDEKIHKMVLLSREHENSIKKAWSSKGVRKAMRPLIKQKVSKRLLLRRLLAEQSTGVFGATHHGEDSSSSDEDRHADDERNNGGEDGDDEDEDEQTTVVGSLFSGTTSRAGPSSTSQRQGFLDEIEEHAAGSSDDAKRMRSLSTAIRQAALWRASQPLSNYADWESFAPPPPRSPEVTFSDVIESIQATPAFTEMRQKWKYEERRKSWMAGDSHHQNEDMKSAVAVNSGFAAAAALSPFKAYSQTRTTAEAISQLKKYQQQDADNKFTHSQPVPPSASAGRRSRTAARRVQSLPAEALEMVTAVDFDLDSISMADPNDDDDDVDDRVSLTSSQRDGCISPLEQSLDDTDSHFEVSSQSSME
uniref:Zeta toxin domain-containing protein n=1 Tax=Globisporangium ultimum (strain ATCC 200006 / CBS 805.95 / DAOM BR144) TaxID=431595 RepID=K3W547_GLOUD